VRRPHRADPDWGINLRDVFRFPVERYADKILPVGARIASLSASVLIARIGRQVHRVQVQLLSRSTHVGDRHGRRLIAPAVANEG